MTFDGAASVELPTGSMTSPRRAAIFIALIRAPVTQRATRVQAQRMPARTQTTLFGFGAGAWTDMRGDIILSPPIMDERKLRDLLKRFRSGKLEEDALLRELRGLPFADLDFAKVDHHRALR